jgi:3-dehydroquinate dehydratase-1
MLKRFELSNIKKFGKVSIGKTPLLCASVTSFDKKTMNKIKICYEKKLFQIYEIRYDYLYKKNIKLNDILPFFKKEEIPYIFTFRRKEEGGKVYVEDDKRLKTIFEALNYDPTLVDIEYEWANKYKELKTSLDKIKGKSGIILSYHNFKNTPSIKHLKSIANNCLDLNADVIKIATLTRSFKDALKILQLAYWIRKNLDIPEIIIGMGKIGSITRITAPFFGSDIIYVPLFERTASGQLNVEYYRLVFRFK